MRKLQTITVGLLAGAVVAATHSQAAEVTAGADVNSAYVWRGITFNDSLVVQPSVDVAHESGLSFNTWLNYDLEDYKVGPDTKAESGEISEVDLTVAYQLPINDERLDVAVGWIEYVFPESGPNSGTREVYGELGYDIGSGVSVGAFVAYDFDVTDDIYANLSLAYGIDVDDNLNVGLSGLVGFVGNGFSDGKDSGPHEWNVSLSGEYVVTSATAFGAFVTYNNSLDSDVLTSATSDVDVYGGVNVYYTF